MDKDTPTLPERFALGLLRVYWFGFKLAFAATLAVATVGFIWLAAVALTNAG